MPSRTVDKLNKLEKAIVSAEDGAEDARWAQAEEVVHLLAAGMTQREVAAGWLNLRAKPQPKPYSAMHVNRCKQVWERFGVTLGLQDRPSWSDAFATVKEGADEIVDTGQRWKEMVEARPPSTEDAAEKFVQKMADADPRIHETILHGLREQAVGRYEVPADRKAHKAEADEAVRPLRKAVIGEFGKLEVVQALEDAKDALADMVRADALDGERLGLIMRAHDAFYEELRVACATIGLEA